MTESFQTRRLETPVYRVTRSRVQPWSWIDWKHVGPDGTFGGRWDDPNGGFRVLYASTQRLTAFVEALAAFRPDPKVLREYESIPADPATERRATPGTLPASWCQDRVVATGVVCNLEGEFVTIGASESLRALRRSFASVGETLDGDYDLDAASIRLSIPRALTQKLALIVATARDERGQPYSGIHYASKHGDDLENWAIFERPSMNGAAPIVSIGRAAIEPDDPDFQEALRLLGLRLG